MSVKLPNKAWVVTVDMGYGHQRAAYPLHSIAYGKIITANNYPGIPDKDKFIWENSKENVSIEDMEQLMTDNFAIDAKTARKDIAVFLNQMQTLFNKNAIQVKRNVRLF